MRWKLLIYVFIWQVIQIQHYHQKHQTAQMQSDSHFEQHNSKIIEQHQLFINSFDQQMIEGKRAIDSINSHINQNKPIVNQKRQFMPIIPEVIRTHLNNEMHNQIEPHSSEVDKNQSQLISNSKVDDLDLQRITKKPSKLFIGCNCLKSKCSKNYCQCFTQGRKCTQLCKCMDCENNSENDNRYRAPMELQEGERACYCKKSNCLKKYCQCYNYGMKCGKNCRCEECKNILEDYREQEREMEQPREETKRQRSEQQIEDINSKVDEIARISPQETKDYILSFLQYWLS